VKISKAQLITKQTYSEKKYNKQVRGEFVFWDKERFSEVLAENEFKILASNEEFSGMTGDKPTIWLNFQLEVVK
jgi:hypothetical protein